MRMKNYSKIAVLTLLFVSTFFSCANIQTIPTSQADVTVTMNLKPIDPEQVKIYKSSAPPDIDKYREIGVVVLRGDGPVISDIFDLIRKEAAEQGAEYVLDFTLKGNLETRTQVNTSTDVFGNLVTYISTYTVIAYTATGTLFARSKR
jgi:hypothetical protein